MVQGTYGKVPVPIDDYDIANKLYVDGSGAKYDSYHILSTGIAQHTQPNSGSGSYSTSPFFLKWEALQSLANVVMPINGEIRRIEIQQVQNNFENNFTMLFVITQADGSLHYTDIAVIQQNNQGEHSYVKDYASRELSFKVNEKIRIAINSSTTNQQGNTFNCRITLLTQVSHQDMI